MLSSKDRPTVANCEFRMIANLLLCVVLVVNTAVAAAVGTRSAADAKVSRVTPDRTSLQGNARLTVFGSGLQQNGMDSQDPATGITVYLVSDDGHVVNCEVHFDGCTTTMTTFYTGPGMKRDVLYYVKMKMFGQPIPEGNYCPNRHDCDVMATYYHTPLISEMTRQTGKRGDLIEICGRIITDRYDSSVSGSLNEQQITRVIVGGDNCELKNDAGDVFRVELTNGIWGCLKCKPVSTFIGNTNFNFLVQAPFGSSSTNHWLMMVTKEERTTNYQLYTGITDFSPKTASLEGGVIITIYADYIDSNRKGSTYPPTTVLVGGEPCEVMTVVPDSHLTCTVPKLGTSKEFYPGNRGLNADYWNTPFDSYDTAKDSQTPPDGTVHFDSTKICGEDINMKYMRLRGVFTAGETSRHQWGIKADNGARLYPNVAPITSTGGWAYSAVFDAIEGQQFAFTAFVKNGNDADACVQMKMIVYDTSVSHKKTAWSNKEMQVININSEVVAETITLKFSGFDTATAVTTVNAKQKLTITEGADTTIRIGLFKVFTVPVQFGDTTSMGRALNNLPFVEDGESFTVTRDTSDAQSVFVELISERGYIPLLETDSSDVTVSEITKGKSAKFSLEMGGTTSPILTYNSDVAIFKPAVKAALSAMYDVRCPTILMPSGPGKHDDYENSANENGIAFCGKYSKKTNTLYKGDEVSVEINQWMCFAVLGLENVILTMHYITPSGKSKRWRRFTITDSILKTPDDEGGWSYTCVNILELMKGENTGETKTKYMLTQAWLEEESEEVYIDAFAMRRTNPIKDLTDISKLRLQPALPNASNKFTVNDVDVEYLADDDKYKVLLHPNNCGHSFRPLAISGITGSGSGDSVSYTLPSGAIIEWQRIAAASPSVEGTYTVTFNGKTSGSLQVSMTDIEIEAVLSGIEGIETVSVERTSESTCANMEIRVYFEDLTGDQPEMNISATLTRPSSATAGISTKWTGALTLSPIYGEFVSTYHTTPQVTMNINNVLTSCDISAGCDFTYSQAATPTVSDISPTSGNNGMTVRITGTGFSTVSVGNVVSIGGVACIVQSQTGTQITCMLGIGPVGAAAVSVNVADKGIATSTVTFTYTSGVSSVSPDTGSTAGGLPISLSGMGFSSQSSPQVGGKDCTVVSVTSTLLVCLTPAKGSEEANSQSVTVTGGTQTATFTYNNQAATITGISNEVLDVFGAVTITISGSGFGNTEGTVTLGSGNVFEIESWTDVEIVAVSPVPTTAGLAQSLSVFVPGLGFALNSNGERPTRDVDLYVDGVSPDAGSMYGGNTQSLSGFGFGTDKEAVSVSVGDHECEVITVTNTNVQFKIPNTATTHKVTNLGEDGPYGIYYTYDPKVVNAFEGDKIEWQWTTPEFLNGINHGVYQTDNMTATVPKAGGFATPQSSPNGKYEVTMVKAGIYYVWSGFVDTYQIKSYRQTINVSTRKPSLEGIKLLVKGQLARYDDSSNTRKKRSTSCQQTDPIAGCTENALTTSEDKPFYHFSKCRSPVITAVNVPGIPGNLRGATASTILTLSGTGLGSVDCMNKAYIGDCPCNVVTGSSTGSQFQCVIDNSCNYPIGELLPVTGYVQGYGRTLMRIQSFTDRSVGYVPSLESISPTSGSTAGGTFVTLSGNLRSVTAVKFNSIDAECEEGSGTSMVCVSPVSTTGGVTIETGSGQGMSCDSCSFTYTGSSTPTVTAASPSIVSGATTITMNGALFSTNAADISTSIGDSSCTNINAISTAQFECDVTAIPAGDNDIVVLVNGLGKAQVSSSVAITGEANINTPTPAAGSVNGGTLVTFTGHGFYGETTVTVADASICSEITVTLAQVVCTTKASSAGQVNVVVVSNGKTYPTVQYEYSDSQSPTITSLDPTTGQAGDILTIVGTSFSADPTKVSVMVGGTECDVQTASETSITCQLGVMSSGSHAVLIDVDSKGYSNGDKQFTYQPKVTSISPTSGSASGNQVLSISGSGFTAETTVTVCDQSCVVDTVTTSAITCSTPSGTADALCSVVVTEDGMSVTADDTYTYTAAAVPSISSVSPAIGGTGGGTAIVITGTGFSDPMTVSIAGSVCSPTAAATSTQIQCTTSAHAGTTVAGIVAEDSSGNRAVAVAAGAASFEYVDMWSSTFTWGGQSPPAEGEMVVVSGGQVIVLDIDTPVLSSLLIRGGKVVFAEKDVTLQAKIILITDGGTLQIGTEDNPFVHKAKVILHGHRNSPKIPVFGNKVLALREGTLELHGIPIPNPWTRLASTAIAGATSINLQDEAESWNVGDEIVITTSGGHNSQRETETRVIAKISADKKTVTLTESLVYKHLGEKEMYSMPNGGADVEFDFGAEVGLLTRNILVRGTSDPSYEEQIEACPDDFKFGEFDVQTCFQGRHGEDEGSDQFGGTIMISSQDKDQQNAQARLSYIELTYMGQAFMLGRYPVHFHLLGNMSLSYVKGCSIHRTFNRAVNVHNTHYLIIQWNVVYNVMGGAMFLEDGVEHDNEFRNNLLIFIRESYSLLNEDQTPAAFWITNANNIYENNVAAGGTHFGFWFRTKSHAEGPSRDPSICPVKIPLQRFEGNTAHSNGGFGIWTFEHFYPMEGGGCNEVNTPKQARILNHRSYNNRKGIEYVAVGAVGIYAMISVNEEEACFEGKLDKLVTKNDLTKSPSIQDSLCIGRAYSDEVFGSIGTVSKAGIVLPLGEGFMINNVEFVNYGDKNPAIKGTSVNGTCGDKCGPYKVTISNIKYNDTSTKIRFRWQHEYQLIVDDTFDGISDGHILASSADFPDTCTTISGYDISGEEAVKCPSSLSFHKFAANNIKPDSLNGKNWLFTNTFGVTTAPYRTKKFMYKDGISVLLLDGETYLVDVENAEMLPNISYHGAIFDLKAGHCNILGFKMTTKPDRNSLDGGKTSGKEWIEPFNCSTQNLKTGDWYFLDQRVYIVFVGDDISTMENRAIGSMQAFPGDYHFSYTGFKCFFPDCTPPPDTEAVPPSDMRPEIHVLWSNTGIWHKDTETGDIFSKDDGGDHGKLPQDGDNVTIPATDGLPKGYSWVLIKDIQVLPKLNILRIYGALEIDYESTKDYDLSANYIIIIGGRLVVGWPEYPILGTTVITLTGDTSTPSFEETAISRVVHPKALYAFGGLDLHGQDVVNSWVHLMETAAAGSKILKVELNKVGQWQNKNTIVISSTSTNPVETEERVIEGVDAATGTITLAQALTYTHRVYTETIGDSTTSFAGTVGLLDRNVIVQGEQSSQSLGGFVQVSVVSYNDKVRTGYARVSNTEFRFVGQEGFTVSDDSRYGLSYIVTGQVSDTKPSYVISNSFHKLYSTGIGVYGTDGLDICKNVVNKPIGHGIVTESVDTTICSNFVTNMMWTGAYDGRSEPFNFRYEAAVMGIKSTGLILKDNIVAASQRVGYRVPGEDCGSTSALYSNNYATGCLLNVAVLPEDNIGGDCLKFSGFIITKAKDYGLYYQNPPSLVVSGNTFAENQVGFMSLIYGPPALSHVCGDKSVDVDDNTFIGSFTGSDCSLETVPSSSDTYLALSSKCRGQKTADGSRSSVLFPTYHSGSNNAMEKPCDNDMSYNALCGKTTMTGNTFMNHGPHVSCGGSYAISTNGAVDDAHHPVIMTTSSNVNNQDDYLASFHMPNVALINPTDCVDMDCDGHKKAIVVDLDGTFTGGDPTTFLPDSASEWGGDPRRGLGDYRIPAAQITNTDGSKRDRTEFAPYTGIVRDGECEFKDMTSFSYFKCPSIRYRLLVIESLDEDTETRRLSPISLTSNGYIDLLNGPQDHGWCSGYTCNTRLSTFTGLVITGVQTDIYMSSTPPLHTRYFILNAGASDCVLLHTLYPDPHRIDVISVNSAGTKTKILPKNGEMVNGKFILKYDPAGTTYIPTCADQHGSSYLDRDRRMIYFIVKGSDMIILEKTSVVVVSLTLPAMTEEEFYGANIIENVAAILNVPINMVRLVKIVKETSTRRRRATGSGSTVIQIEIGPDPSDTESTATNEEIVEEAATLMTQCQTGTISESLGTEVDSCDEITVEGITYQPAMPETLRFELSPVAEHEGVPLAVQPKIRAYDSYGAVIQDLGIAADPWQIQATLRSGSGHASATLTGTTTLSASSGWFNFNDISISHAGAGYIIDFEIVHPTGTNLTAFVELDVNPLPLTAGVHSMTTVDIEEGTTFAITFDLRDSSTNQVLPDVNWRSHTFVVTCGEMMNPGKLAGTLTNNIDTSTGRAEFDDWSYAGNGFIYVECRVVSSPAEYDIKSYHKVVILSTEQMAIPTERTENVVVRYLDDFSTTLTTKSLEAQVHQATIQELVFNNPSIIIRSSTIEPGSIVITMTVEGLTHNVTAALENICDDISDGAVVTAGTLSLQLDRYMVVDGNDFFATCGKPIKDEEKGLHIGFIILIVIICIIVVAAIILLIVWFCCVKPKKKVHDNEYSRNGRQTVAESPSQVDNRFQQNPYADGFFYIDNGRMVYLPNAGKKMPDKNAPTGTALYDIKPGERYNNQGMMTRKEPSAIALGHQEDNGRTITPTSG